MKIEEDSHHDAKELLLFGGLIVIWSQGMENFCCCETCYYKPRKKVDTSKCNIGSRY